jgi:hypothetical protein
LPQLVVKVVGRGFAFHSINMEVIQQRKCKGCLWTLNGSWVEPKPQDGSAS